MIEYKVIFQKRKSIQIQIIEKDVIVKAPIHTNKEIVDSFVKKKEKWIIETLNKIDKRVVLAKNEILFNGEVVKKIINVQPFMKRNFVIFDNDKFIINVKKKEDSEIALRKWLISYAEKKFKEKVAKYEKFFDKKPTSIKIREQKTIWGSCSYDNKLSFNVKLLLARESALEYVVVHEMCHMIHKDHSKNFWSLVETIYPKYKEEERWLKEKGYLLKI